MNDNNIFKELKEVLLENKYSQKDISEIERAFEYSSEKHEGQYRVSEEPYIVHPVEVAKILVGLKLDKNTIIAALLHDIIEDTGTRLKKLNRNFQKMF